jgi:cell division protein FtsZ
MGTGVGRGDARATIATEAAINSPLLEDVDLKGASGILVNITAGLDLSLGEFTEVGNIIEEYASDTATIVVGTVIDPEMSDEIKVTVVATGLCKAQEVKQAVNSGMRMRAVRSASVSTQVELPSGMRPARREERFQVKRAEEKSTSSEPAKRTGTDDMEFLDIPAFLRRQAD